MRRFNLKLLCSPRCFYRALPLLAVPVFPDGMLITTPMTAWGVAGGDSKVENIEVVGKLSVKGGSLRANVVKVKP